MNSFAHSFSRRTALGLIGAGLVLPRAGRAETVNTRSVPAFGTHWRIAGARESGLDGLASAIANLSEGIDRLFSPWRPDSVISLINAAPAGLQTVDPGVIEVTTAALQIARLSEGAFDPTVGPLVARWGFGPIHQGGAPGWRGVSAGPKGLAKARPDLTLDLCGIAKGWALDQAARLARSRGLNDMLLGLGGEYFALGQHPDGRDWRIGLEAPMPSQPAVATLRLPPGFAVATSGMRAQSYALNERLYSHIIDPETRAPVAGRLRSVTVAAADAMTADGWATALCAAGDAAGPDLAATHTIAALFLFEQEGAVRQVRTGAIGELIL